MQARKKKRIVNRVSPGSRKGVGKRIPKRSVPIGRGQVSGGTTAPATRADTPFVLRPSTKELTDLHVTVLQGAESPFADPAEQLKAIQDLYPVISGIRGYRENLRWTADSSPSDVLAHLLKQFSSLTKTNDWGIDVLDSKYTISSWQHLGDERPYWIQVKHLAQINRSHPVVHELMFYAIMLVAKYNGVALTFLDWVKTSKQVGNHGMTYEYFLEQSQEAYDADDQKRIDDTYAYYGPDGIPAAYARLMSGGASLKIFREKFKAYKPSGNIGKVTYPFLKAALQLAETKESIHDYCDRPPGYDEHITPLDSLGIIWSWEDSDRMWQQHCEVLDSFAQGFGVLPFCWKDTFDPVKNKQSRAFLDIVMKFFEAGTEMSNELDLILKGVPEQMPIPFKKRKSKNDRLINILV